MTDDPHGPGEVRLIDVTLPRWAVVIVVGFVGLTVTLFAVLASYSLPVFDDFCRACASPSTEIRPTTEFSGLFRAPAWMYLNWSGRWLAVFSEIVVMNYVDIVRWYPALLLALWITYFVATSYFFRLIYPDHPWKANLIFWMLLASSTPEASGSLLNITFSIENTGVGVLALCGWALFDRAGAMDSRRASSLRIAACLTAVCVAGIHELAGIALSAAIAFRLLHARLQQEQGAWRWGWFLIAAVVGVSLNVVAPGNWVRASLMFAGDEGSANIARVFLSQSFSALKLWLLGDLRFWTATVFLACLAASLPYNTVTARDRWLVRAAVTAIVLVGFAVPSAAMKAPMPGRTLSQVYFLFVAAWFFLVRVEVSAWVGARPLDRKLIKAMAAASLLMFSGSAALEGNARTALRDLRFGDAAAWHREHMNRIDLLRAAASSSSPAVTLPPIEARPSLLVRPNDSANPDYAANLCMEWYFGVPSVSVDVD